MNSSELEKPLQNRTDRTETGQTNQSNRTETGVDLGKGSENATSSRKAKLPKTHQGYWVSRLQKRTYKERDGTVAEIPTWQVRMFHNKREGWFNLDTTNQTVASTKARDLYLFLRANDWEATLAKFKPETVVTPKGNVTVGEFLDQVAAVSGLKRVTFEIYARKFRSLVAGVFKIDGGRAKHDHVNGGYALWLEKVRAVRLERLTPERINEWKVSQLRTVSDNPLQHKHTGITVRSILLCSKALFAPKVRRLLTLNLPTPLPFEGIALPKAGKSRYKSEIEPSLLLTAAKRELCDGILVEGKEPTPQPELFKIILLALGAGLRRDEIDKLEWRQILWDRAKIRIETTEHGSRKSEDSEGDVDVDPGLLEILRGYVPKPSAGGSGFVIESGIAPRPGSTKNHHYRCNLLFKKTVQWLHSKGLTSRNALHALRKEYGSQICQQAGIYAASVALRHSSITLTRDYYLDKKSATYLDVSKLMKSEVAS